MTLPACVLWIDPGGMTGLASYDSPSGWFRADEHEFFAAGNRIYSYCAAYKASLWIGWERFKVGPRTPPQNVSDAIEMIGVARYWALSWGCRILTPANSGDRKGATRPMLQMLGWWVPGKDDAQAAAQHMLAWMMREHLLPPREHSILRAARTQGDDHDGPEAAPPAARPQQRSAVRPPVQEWPADR